MAGDCVFCERVKHGRYDSELSLPGSVAVFEPLNPVTPGHLLVVPFEHVRDAAEKPHVTGTVMEHAARLIAHFGYGVPYQANIITSVGPDASQSVFHFHAHLVPRRAGDGLTLPWTGQARRPVPGEMKNCCGEPYVLHEETATDRPGPAELWQQACGDRDEYMRLMREHGHVVRPGDTGYDPDAKGLACGWEPGQ